MFTIDTQPRRDQSLPNDARHIELWYASKI